jgi:cobalt-zinc-cadmium efflux system membrane fusion protein
MRWINFISIMLWLSACTSAPEVEEPLNSTEADDYVFLSAEQLQLAGVVLGLPRPHRMSHTLECMATVASPPGGEVRIHAPVQGFVAQLPARLPGEFVRQGDMLAQLSHPDFARIQRELLETHSQLRFLESDWKRKQELAEGDVASQRVLQEAEANYGLARARFQGLSAELEMMGFGVVKLLESGEIQRSLLLRAPVSGILASIHVQPGQLVGPEELLFSLIDPSKLLLEIQVFAKDLPLLKSGQKLEGFLPGSDQVYLATLQQVGALVGGDSRSAVAYAKMDKGVGLPPPGSLLQVRIDTDERDALTVPESAIARDGASTFVFVRAGEGFRRLPVQPGRSRDNLVELLGFEYADTLVIQGAYYLHGNMMEED